MRRRRAALTSHLGASAPQDANFVKDVLKELPGVDSSDPRIVSMLDKIKDKRAPTAAYSASLSPSYGSSLSSALSAVSISPFSSSVSTRLPRHPTFQPPPHLLLAQGRGARAHIRVHVCTRVEKAILLQGALPMGGGC